MKPLLAPFLHFLREINRRRVPHTLGLYLVAAIGILEAADLTFPRLGLPDWTVTLVLALLLLALPVVAILAWFYDIGGRGIERTASVDDEVAFGTVDAAPDRLMDRDPGSGRMTAAAVGVVLSVVGLIVVAGWAITIRVGGESDALRADLVAVLPFRATGDAQGLAEGMLDLLAAKLTGEGGLRAVEPRTALAAWRGTGGSDEGNAQQTARRLGAGRLLLGSVVEVGGRLHLAGRIHDTETFEEMARYELEGQADSLPGLVDRFAAGLLTQLAGVDADRIRQLDGTPLPALRTYLDGHAALRAGQFHDAVERFDQALAHDSTFALAGMFHDIASGFTSAPSSTGRRLAWEHRDRLSPRDRATLDGWWAGGEGRTLPEELAGLTEMTRAVPDRAEAWYLRGDAHYHWAVGTPLPQRLDTAEEFFTAATRLDPDFGPANLHLLEIALFRADTATARARARAILATNPEGDLADGARWLLAALDGNGPELRDGGQHPSTWEVFTPIFTVQYGTGLRQADRSVEWALERLTDANPTSLAGAAVYFFDRGRPERAETIAADRLRVSPLERALMRTYAALYWETGLPPDSLEHAVRSLDGLAGEIPEAADRTAARCAVAQADVHLGLPGRALRRAADLRGAGEYGEMCALLVRALALAETDATRALDAVEALDRAHADGRLTQRWLRDAAPLVLARGYEAAGDLERALGATLRRVVGVPGVHFYSTAIREEARLAARLGRTDQAVRAYRHYLELRTQPDDAVQPLVERARQELAALASDN